ncbi:MAG: hypothetical protein IJ187_05490 [Neisseriaceae bacterium]|nr:hypothetical protein [Neisseriaceae bacterium]
MKNNIQENLLEKIYKLEHENEYYREILNSKSFEDSKKTVAHLTGRMIIDFFKNPIKNFITPRKIADVYWVFINRKQYNGLSVIEKKLFDFLSRSRKPIELLDNEEEINEEKFQNEIVEDEDNTSLLDVVSQYAKQTGDEYLLLNNEYSKLISVKGKKNVTVTLKMVSPNKNKINQSVLMWISFLDENGNLLLQTGSLPVHPKYGNYSYLSVGELHNYAENTISIDIVEGASFLKLTVVNWKKGNLNYLVNDIAYNFEQCFIDNSRRSVKNYLSNGDKVIVLYTTAPYWGSGGKMLRPNRLAKEYIELGYKVIFFSFSRVPEEHKYGYYNSCLMQYFKDDMPNIIYQIEHYDFEEQIFICTSFPDILAMTIIDKLKLQRKWHIVYEIRDDMEEFNRVGYSKWYTTQLEIRVAQQVDKVITVSPRLAQKISVMANLSNNKVKVIQNAAPDELIYKTEYLRDVTYLKQKTKSKVIGYIGHLTPAWFDWVNLLYIAKKHPEWKIELIGDGEPNNLVLPKNVRLLGHKTHDEFLKISENWKVGLIPFIKSPLTSSVDPNKIYEYLSANLLVVTANMGSVDECPATFVYHSDDEFEKMLELAMRTKYNEKILFDINQYVYGASWSMRANSILNFILERNIE